MNVVSTSRTFIAYIKSEISCKLVSGTVLLKKFM